MEQRPLRLGDTLDDYCPRERRVTNHAIVAMVEEDIKQTRCTTCDAEHAYKGGHAPKRRKKDSQSALYKEVLAGLQDPEVVPALPVPAVALTAPVAVPPSDITAHEYAAAPPADDEPVQDHDDDATEPQEEPAGAVEEGPVHRPLIRATLPRIEGQKEERRAPDFTIRQAGARGPQNFRGGGTTRMNQRSGEPNGNRTHGGPRFGAGRPAGRGPAGRGGQSPSFRGGAPRHGGGGKKRSR